MDKEEMKNKISMTLKDPILQQGFEIICKENAELQEENKKMADLDTALEDCTESLTDARIKIKELEKELEQAKKVQVVEHFEAYGQCRDSRRIASLETENVELKDKLKNLESVAEVRLANWQKYEKELKSEKEYSATLRKEIDEYTNSHTLCAKYKELKTQAKEIILKLYNAGRDVLMCRADEAAYDNLSTVINDRSIEQFLKECEEW